MDSPAERIGCIKCKHLFHFDCVLNKSPNPNINAQTCEECDIEKANYKSLVIKKNIDKVNVM